MGAVNSVDDTVLMTSYPRMAAPSRQVVFGCLPVRSILTFVSCRYCPFLLKIIFSYLIFLVAVVSVVSGLLYLVPSISSSSWFFVCLKTLVSKPKVRDAEQVSSSQTLKRVMLLRSVLPYHLPTLVLFWF